MDRQQYGEKLLDRLSEALMKKGVSRCERRGLYRYRQFYLTYPKIVETLSPQSGGGAWTALNLLSFSHFVDLVFYHRILKCHVLAELKVAAFSHENIGQLNTYVSWYRKNMMTEGDNPPVGILLCTQKDHALVEYALAGIDNALFVSKYLLELPKKEEIQRIIEQHLATSGDGRHVTSA